MQKTAVQRRDPETKLWGMPNWCNSHCHKMEVEQLDQQNGMLVISGSAAKVIIRKASLVYSEANGWFVDWEVIHSRSEKATGRVFFTSDDLKAAFNLSESSGECGDWLIKRFGAESAEQGKYIRWKNFLNIPCPGTGNDGDPNISIELGNKIENAVQQLLSP